MSSVTSAAPQAILHGIDDQSIRTLDPVQEQLPQHLPYVLIPAERGKDTVELTGGAHMLKLYGAKTFDPRGKFFNHSTVLVDKLNANGNLMMMRRVIPQDATTSMLRLSLELIASELPVYERNTDGTFKLDVDGAKIDTGSTVPGLKGRWVVGSVTDAIGGGSKVAGTLTGSDGALTSTVYPIIDFGAYSAGAFGNNVGIRLSAPTVNSNQPVDDEVIDNQEAYLYRLQIVERPDAKSAPVVQRTLSTAQFVEFSFKDGVINPKLDTELSFNKTAVSNWTDVDETSGLPPVYGVIDQMHLYSANLEEALSVIGTAIEGAATDMPHMYNAVSGVDVDEVPYENFELVGPEEGGVLLTESTTHYLTGGNDGTLSLDTFNTDVGNLMDNFENDPLNLMDEAQYPFSIIYDTGYPIEVKRKLFIPMGLRKDVATIVGTHVVGEDQLSVIEESSMAMALRNAARMYPESFLYGTSTCRAAVVAGAGYLTQSSYDKLVPMTVDLADKLSKYMGAAIGDFSPEFAIDEGANNQVTLLRGVENFYKYQRVRNKDWANGMVWVQKYDRRRLFYPQFQTVYDNDTSVLNSIVNMLIAVELEKVCQRTWRDLTGKAGLTKSQLIDESNRLIESRTVGRFGGRAVIVPETYLTPDDTKRGYSWSCNINMYANNMVTVGSFTIVAKRMEDLE